MKQEQDFIRDIAAIRSMMERTSKFLSISGWAGVMAGIYALAGAHIVYRVLHFNPNEIFYNIGGTGEMSSVLSNVILVAVLVLVLALGTAIILSVRKAGKKGEPVWNPVSKELLGNMAVPLIVGGILILAIVAKGLLGLMAPLSLLFYGLALFNAGKFTYPEIKTLGLFQIGLGLICTYKVEYGIVCWALGFGVLHIIYGIYLHYKYER